jgi:hypothetical protein
VFVPSDSDPEVSVVAISGSGNRRVGMATACTSVAGGTFLPLSGGAMRYTGGNQSQERIQSLDFSYICFSHTSCICSFKPIW